jgi:hypothetical protein
VPPNQVVGAILVVVLASDPGNVVQMALNVLQSHTIACTSGAIVNDDRGHVSTMAAVPVLVVMVQGRQ